MKVQIMVSAPGRQDLTTTFEASGEKHIAEHVAGLIDFALKIHGSSNNLTIRITHNPHP
ncbi:MAG: hypothetical protein V4610_07750 [Pseudomonadota bacterium]